MHCKVPPINDKNYEITSLIIKTKQLNYIIKDHHIYVFKMCFRVNMTRFRRQNNCIAVPPIKDRN